jgi:chemotaxis protein CheY-P-specific phosphatase CheC
MDVNAESLALDVLGESLNLGLGQVIDELTDIAHSKIQLHVPEVAILPRLQALKRAVGDRGNGAAVFVQQPFSGDLNGEALLCFSEAESLHLLNSLSTEHPESHIEFSETEEEMLLDLTNVAVTGVIYAMSNILGMSIEADLPKCEYGFFRDIQQSPLMQDDKEESVLFLTICFTVVERNSTAQLMFFQQKESLPLLYEKASEKLTSMINEVGE